MHCRACGTKISDDSLFCKMCGSEVTADLDRDPDQVQSVDRSDRTKSVKCGIGRTNKCTPCASRAISRHEKTLVRLGRILFGTMLVILVGIGIIIVLGVSKDWRQHAYTGISIEAPQTAFIAPETMLPTVNENIHTSTKAPIPTGTMTPLQEKIGGEIEGVKDFLYASSNDTKKYSFSDEQVWQYCNERWDYYDSIHGGYSGDIYTNQVFQDASEKFGITTIAAENIWNRVDKSKLGLE